MIQKVSFRNFKAYRSLDLELEPFTVLVGPNASGKTTLLRGVDFIANLGALTIGSQGLSPTTRVKPGVRAYGSSAPVELGIEGSWGGTAGSFRVTSTDAVPNVGADPGPESQDFKARGTWGGGLFHVGESRASGTFNPPLEVFGSALSSTTVLRFEPRRLAEPSYSEEAVPRIHFDGSGLASVLAHLKLSWDEAFAQIELALKQVVPAVRRIRIERATVEQTAIRTISLDEQRHEVPEKRTLWGQKIVLDMKGAKGVPADAAGEGTLMALGLLTVLMGPTQPRLVLLDDIELGLHPAAQGKLIEVLRKLQERDPELQIIATSHSPFILNYLDPKEVRMTFLAENGFARCEKLTAHPEFERWKGMMSPGEFWSTVGESWLEKASEPAAHE
ncbi:AAA family ATPase [Archangium sp.]|uniref:AAA family ATPase n=1 Tax=Archangium sp. TaxID=1872627 RepID=UPI003899E33D